MFKLFFKIIVLNVFIIPTWALDPQPRKWSHIPIDTHIFAVAGLHTEGKIYTDESLDIDNAEFSVEGIALKYIYTFPLFKQSARVDILQPWLKGEWSGQISGEQQSTRRTGLGDSIITLNVNLIGAPALSKSEFAKFKKSNPVNTTIGTALSIRLPTGQYDNEKYINLGHNRFGVRPQLGVVYQYYKWIFELTGEVFMFTDNTDYLEGNRLAQSALYFTHAHVNYNFGPGWWAGVGVGYDYGGQKSVNGNDIGEQSRNVGWAFTMTFPLSKLTGIRVNFIDTQTLNNSGVDAYTGSLSLSHIF